MIPADIDPSLHSGEPVRERLDDGFSPPPADTEADAAAVRPGDPEAALATKSEF